MLEHFVCAGLSELWLHKQEQIYYAIAVVCAFVVTCMVTQDVLHYCMCQEISTSTVETLFLKRYLSVMGE